MTTTAVLSSSSFSYNWTYDIFLSFRGDDTRIGFAGNLYNALHQRGIHTFIDDEKLQRGEQITPALHKAIEQSRIAIIVFSKNYASSTFCLSELVKILDCIKGQGRLVWPVFYDVDPSEVRHQKGIYGESLAEHERKSQYNTEIVQKWGLCLLEAANLSGWHFKHGVEYEHAFIERIVKEVSSKLDRTPLHIAKHPVGLERRVLAVKSLIDVGFQNRVSMVGILGIRGIGKSVLARAIYNLIADQFEGLCFLPNVRESSAKHGLEKLQETLLYELVKEKNIKLRDINQGIPILKRRLQEKKVLVILDDVDKIEQLEALAGALDWFGNGSAIIITTRDNHLLNIHGVRKKYEVKALDHKEALELFCWNAFKSNEVDPNYMDISEGAVHYAQGLPLVLEVIGSNWFGKSINECKSALDIYRRIPIGKVQDVLKVSYDGWTYDVFLSFRGEDTRFGFTGNLYYALHQSGIHTFSDDMVLGSGETITSALHIAIENSRVAIVILSKWYASSTFCLDELVKILECIKGQGRFVWPIFYDVDPSEVRHQKGSYGYAMAKHEDTMQDNKEKVQKWRWALRQVANLAGWRFIPRSEYEYKFIRRITKEVSRKINGTPLHIADYPVGLAS